MKYLVLLLVLLLGIGTWRSRRAAQGATPPPRASAQDMPACAHCGVHIPQAEAWTLGNQAYCCAEHRQLGPG
ncbi:hypothetical protein D8B23_08355 [Verminephrobacter aporrectodeae subsp. tuberculatae]|uniref:PP0621 family protein n=1 Tax=Verminephrobacter aporrectodeae TaxID=1110389 RepID=UPI002244B2AB|nr:PP0621 family protein [Verminephrobacter aporrectodeae]MCW8198431.1 hypothetical protein [Verminephrobacter aporrectodeae subsp. tuberculatae]